VIRKLRRKFVAINMALVALVFALVFCFLMVRTVQEQQDRISAALDRAAAYVQISGEQPAGETQAAAPDAAAAPAAKAQTASDAESDSEAAESDSEAAESRTDEAAESDDETPDAADAANPVLPRLRGDKLAGANSAEQAAAGVATFWAQVDASGAVTDSGTDGVTLTDDACAALTAEALAAGKTAGVLRDAGYSFRVAEINGAKYVVFADRSAAAATVRSLALNLGLVAAAALAAFWAISWFLARWALRPVEAAWEEQRRFLADASHELKTPLTVILANTDILCAHPAATVESQRKWLDGTREEGARMKKLIDDLLFLARSDAALGSTAPKTPAGRVDLSDLAQGAILSFESVAFEKGVAVSQAIAPGLAVRGDENSLSRLLTILLDNACKYAGGEKRVTVTLRAERETALLTVANTGAPIPPEVLPHLFERFYRADESRARGAGAPGGYGLGLAIAHTIAQAHGGALTAESDEKSTRFLVRLPLTK
jgi:signal transduction histidine kinase